MKTKKLLFGLIEMNGTLYNILYTVLCVVVLLILVGGQATLITSLIKENIIKNNPLWTILNTIIMYFLISKLFDKNNYI